VLLGRGYAGSCIRTSEKTSFTGRWVNNEFLMDLGSAIPLVWGCGSVFLLFYYLAQGFEHLE
jgi:hypothetical protein